MQPHARKRNSGGRTVTSAVGAGTSRLINCPCLADERSLSEAVLGRGKYTHWRAIIPLLEGRGFPKIDGLMGGRYTAAVRAYFDREYGIGGVTPYSRPMRRRK